MANTIYCAILAALAFAVIVGMLHVWAATGPNCPAPVPADWLGFCEDYKKD